MNIEQIELLTDRLIKDQICSTNIETESLKKKRDKNFCIAFFGAETVIIEQIDEMLHNAISTRNEYELDLLLMLIEHFEITVKFDLTIAPLLIQPWHHLHDRIASILELDKNQYTVDLLFLGAKYRCDNLDYESDYCEFNRKCLFALLKIGTPQAIQYIKDIADSHHKIISTHAQTIVKKYIIA